VVTLHSRLHVFVLHNNDHDVLEDDPGREARKDVLTVAQSLCDAVERSGITAEPLPVNDLVETFELLRREKPALVVNLCESLAADSRGEMALPCLLDVVGIPYTGSGALALGLALHKNKAKEVLLARGVPTPAFRVVETLAELAAFDLELPVIVKPAREDASVGIDFSSVAKDRASLGAAVAHVLRTFRQPALIERYIEGREIYVPLLGNRPRRALPLTEIRFGAAFEGKPKILSYRAKWELDSPECVDSPAVACELPKELHHRVVATALAAFDALECRDYGRVDLRVSADGQPWVIDINPNCDLNREAGFARAALAAGIQYRDLALHLVEIALERSHGNPSSVRAGPRTTRGAAGANRNVLAARSGLRPRAHRPGAQARR
jgi:D-alanine-D-alanine ligase